MSINLPWKRVVIQLTILIKTIVGAIILMCLIAALMTIWLKLATMSKDDYKVVLDKIKAKRALARISPLEIPKRSQLEKRLAEFYRIIRYENTEEKTNQVVVYYLNKYANDIEKIIAAKHYSTRNLTIKHVDNLKENLNSMLDDAIDDLINTMLEDMYNEKDKSKSSINSQAKAILSEFGIKQSS